MSTVPLQPAIREVEKLNRCLLDRDLTIAQLQTRVTELSQSAVPSGHMMAAMRANTDHWQDSYHRLSEAHRRLQRVNQGLEDKLLKMADRSQTEKEALTEHTTSLTTALTTAASAIHRLKGEKERLQQDLNIAIQLLQCNSSRYSSHRIDSLPADLQQRVRCRMEVENQHQQRINNGGGKTTDMKIIKVPIPTFPPTAMVYSLNKCSDDAPDEEDVQEAEDMVSAAIMAAVLEERQKEQKHCPTCTCTPGNGRTHTAASDRPSAGSGGGGGARYHRPGDHRPTDTIDNKCVYDQSAGGRKNYKGSTVVRGSVGERKHTSQLDSIANGHTVAAKHVKNVVSSSSLTSAHRHSNCRATSNTLVSKESMPNINESKQYNASFLVVCDSNLKQSNNNLVSDHTRSIPLIDSQSGGSVISVAAGKAQKKTRIIELNSLNITEHFNSETLDKLIVNKCMCGRPYSVGANVIDVGTQTVPSYIGESGKVHSTCIYCKGLNIKGKLHEKNCHRVMSNSPQPSERMSSPQSYAGGDCESPSLASPSGAASRYGSDTNLCLTNGRFGGQHQVALPMPHSPEVSSPLRDSVESACSWEWSVVATRSGECNNITEVDSGSPSTPSSFTSYESGLSSAPSPQRYCAAPDCVSVTTSVTAASITSSLATSDACAQCDAVTTANVLVQTTDGVLITEDSEPVRVDCPSNTKHTTQCNWYDSVDQVYVHQPSADNRHGKQRSDAETETAAKRPFAKRLSSSLDKSHSLEVSADLLARLTSTIDCFDLKVREMTWDKDVMTHLDTAVSYDMVNYNNDNSTDTLGIVTDVDNGSSAHNTFVHRPLYESTVAPPRLYHSVAPLAPSIHRLLPRCSEVVRLDNVVASTATASTTVTTL